MVVEAEKPLIPLYSNRWFGWVKNMVTPALVSGNMDQNPQSAGGLILTHTQVSFSPIGGLAWSPNYQRKPPPDKGGLTEAA